MTLSPLTCDLLTACARHYEMLVIMLVFTSGFLDLAWHGLHAPCEHELCHMQVVHGVYKALLPGTCLQLV